jgi:hypothetical protein
MWRCALAIGNLNEAVSQLSVTTAQGHSEGPIFIVNYRKHTCFISAGAWLKSWNGSRILIAEFRGFPQFLFANAGLEPSNTRPRLFLCPCLLTIHNHILSSQAGSAQVICTFIICV